MKKNIQRFLELVTNRVFLVFCGVCVGFTLVIGQFYKLQIIEHHKYVNNLRASVERQIEITAPRGLIYDRYGRALAVNQPHNVLRFDQQVPLKRGELNEILLKVAKLLESHGDTYHDKVPITMKAPFEYTGTEREINQFMYNVPYNNAAHREELLTKSAEELIAYLSSAKVFNINQEIYTPEEVRKIIAMRLEIHPFTYRKYNLVTLAQHISEETVTHIEENHKQYPGIIVDVEPIRYYPEGEILGNILGYTRAITENQYDQMKELGYDKNDIVGHEGIEKSMEAELRGVKGNEKVEVDNLGRRVHTIYRNDAVAGNDIYLTIDLDLQRAAYESVERRLSEAIIERLKGENRDVRPLTSKEVIVSMLESSQLDLKTMESASEESLSYRVYQRLIDAYNELDQVIKENLTPLDLLIKDLDETSGMFTEREIMLILNEQHRLHLTPDQINDLQKNLKGTTERILIHQLENGYLKPNQFSIDPFSAAAVVQDVNTGEILALVGYPSYDSNQMTTNFNQYYTSLFDNRSMLWNRAVMTKEAPGSTFKMLTGIAGLEEGVITPETLIFDTGVYEKAGSPAPKCWIHPRTGGGHGNVNLTRGIEVSCNYYFYEVAFRLGLLDKEPYHGIDTLTKYVEMFGLGEPTGIEIAEAEPNISTPKNLVKNQLTTVFNQIRNTQDETFNRYVEPIVSDMKKGIYPFANSQFTDIDGQIEHLVQYELKRNIEPVLQDAFEDELANVIQEAYRLLSENLKIKSNEVIDTIVDKTMHDPSNRSLRLKTKEQLMVQLDLLITKEFDTLLQSIVETIDVYDILDAYEYAYDIMYARELRKDPESEVVKELRERLRAIDEEEEHYKNYLTKQIRYSIINEVANQCLRGLELEWRDGTTVRTAIGQGQNAFTPVQMARYIAGLANGETVYNVRVVNGIYDVKDEGGYIPSENQVFGELNFKPTTIPVIHQGMFDVVNGQSGSARHEFRNFPVQIAAKTGTAQKAGREHSWFAGFAPYKEPQIAFVTTMYYADALGKYGRFMARDILTEYFGMNKERDKTTLEHMFIE